MKSYVKILLAALLILIFLSVIGYLNNAAHFEANIRQQYTEIDHIYYNALMTEPEKHSGTKWKASGRVFQIYETEGATQEFLFELYDAKIIYVEYHTDESINKISEGDKLELYGTFYQTVFYPAPLGEFLFVPKLDCNYAEYK